MSRTRRSTVNILRDYEAAFKRIGPQLRAILEAEGRADNLAGICILGAIIADFDKQQQAAAAELRRREIALHRRQRLAQGAA